MIGYSLAQLDRPLSQLGFWRLKNESSTRWVENPTTDINLALGPIDIFPLQAQQDALGVRTVPYRVTDTREKIFYCPVTPPRLTSALPLTLYITSRQIMRY